MLLDSINYLAVLVAAIAAFGVAAIWYGALFSKAWTAAIGKPVDQLGKPLASMLVTFLGYLLMAFMTAIVHIWVGVASPGQGVTVAIFLWIGFAFPSFAPGIMFSGASRRLLWLDGGHLLLAFIVAGAIIGAWRIAPPVLS
jgi:hypothetical protein